MAEELTTKQFVDIETGKPISNPVYIGDVYDKDGADAVLRLFGQDKTRDTCGRVGDYRITDDPVLAENHLWPDGGPIDPVAWPELHAYAARLGWQTDAAGHFLLPDLRGKYLVGADSRDPDFAAGKESGEKAHTLTKAELPNVSIGLGAAVIKSDTEAIRVTDSGPLWYRMGRSVQETAGPLGNGEPHNNLPPYRAVYIQLRAKPDPVVAQEVAADRLATARRIGSTSFDGSGDITLAQMGAMAASSGIHNTTETDTGEIWIDGRKIYRKTFEVQSALPTGAFEQLISIDKFPNIFDFVGVTGFRISPSENGGSNGIVMMPLVSNGSLFHFQAIKMDLRGVELFRTIIEAGMIPETVYTWYLDVRYTKTTD